MANQYSADVPKGFNVPKQVRLDSITGIQNEITLKNLGSGNNLAFKYYEGLKIYCKDEKTEYVWREVIGVETGLLDTHFIYPTYSPIDGINYSGKSFNFFEITNSNITPPDGSETKLVQGSNITITGIGTIVNPYTISSNSEISETYINEGDNINITGSGIISDPYIINSNLDNLGIVKTIGNEVISPGQSLSIINNESTGKVLTTKEYVQSIIPSTPDGSETKINSGNNISITGSGTISNPYIINSISNAGSVYINPGDNVEIIGNGTVENPYVISSVDTNTTYLAGAGLVLSGTTFNIENLQKVITYPTDFTGTNYTLTNADNNYEIIVDNGITAVTITVPSGLTSKIGVGFTQKGIGDISYTASGTTINNPIGLKIKGQYYQTFLSQESNTNLFYLGGNTKI